MGKKRKALVLEPKNRDDEPSFLSEMNKFIGEVIEVEWEGEFWWDEKNGYLYKAEWLDFGEMGVFE